LPFPGITPYTNPIFPLGGSQFSVSAKVSFPYSLVNDIDYANLGDQAAHQNTDGTPDQAKIDQEKFRWLEYYKLKVFWLLVQYNHRQIGTENTY
jgi:outer membrane protein insertion porin family